MDFCARPSANYKQVDVLTASCGHIAWKLVLKHFFVVSQPIAVNVITSEFEMVGNRPQTDVLLDVPMECHLRGEIPHSTEPQTTTGKKAVKGISSQGGPVGVTPWKEHSESGKP